MTDDVVAALMVVEENEIHGQDHDPAVVLAREVRRLTPLVEAQEQRWVVLRGRLLTWAAANDSERAMGKVPTFLNPHTVLAWIGPDPWTEGAK